MRVVVCGAGYAGVTAGRSLETSLPDDVTVTVIDRDPHHLIQHELHRVIRRPGLAETIAIPLGDVFDRAEIVRGRIDGIHPDGRTVTLADGSTIRYDFGVICLGGGPEYYDLRGVETHSIPLKRLEHARRIRERVGSIRPAGTVVVGGAGLAGVQVAGELAALNEEIGGSLSIVLLEQASSVAPTFPEPFRTAVHRELIGRGVDVRTGRTVTGATDETVTLAEGEPLAYDAFVWTGGLRGPTAFDGRRPRVRSDLRLTDRTFVVGDTGRMIDADGGEVPATAQAATRAGRTAARNVRRLVEFERDGANGFEPRLDRFRFDPAGWIVSVGDGAVAQIGSRVLIGTPAMAIKASVGVRYLSSVGAVRNAVGLVNRELDLDEAIPADPDE